MGRRTRPNSIDHSRTPQLRAELLNTAARLIAEEGVTDLHLAKRKAIRLLGLPESYPLPSNDEVQAALKEYQALFVGPEQAEHLRFLREVALDLMALLQDFRPFLTGSVLDGTAGEYSSIDLLLFPDSAKDVEIFLLNQDLAFRHGTPRDERIEAVFVLDDSDSGVSANLIVLDPMQLKHAPRPRDGKGPTRANRDSLAALMHKEIEAVA